MRFEDYIAAFALGLAGAILVLCALAIILLANH